jgi:tetratricopeptide (TPR) repeat protein
MTLPLVFVTRLESIPGDTPYITVDAKFNEAWQEKVNISLANLPVSASILKVGLVWAGGSTYINDRKRSVALAQLAPLALSPDTIFFSLQKGSAAAEAAHPPPGMMLVDLTADITDFADTAALIAQLDLVIAVDTGVAHLAGALGKPVWLMLPTNPDWRWLLNRDDSPWYPTMRLFRQTRRGEWTDVIDRVATALAGLQAGTSADAGPISPDAPRKLSTADAIALAYQHHQAGRLAEAGGIYRQILAQQPDNVDVLHLMGLAAMQARRIEMAVACLSRAAKLSPAEPEYQHNLGLALAASGDHAAAVDAYRNAIQLNADFPDAHYNLGNALLKLKRFDEAIDAYQIAVQSRPQHVDAHINLGSALAGAARYAEAIDAFRQAISLDPNHAEAHMNLGLALVEERKFDEAIPVLRRSISLDPSSGESHWLLSLLSLLRGDFELGWQEYEWRWHRREEKPHPQNIFPEPRWNGENLNDRPSDLVESAPRTVLGGEGEMVGNESGKLSWHGRPARGESKSTGGTPVPQNVSKLNENPPQIVQAHFTGRTVLLHAEQGQGDAIQFIRYAPLVAGRGGRVIVQCPPRLSRLFKTVQGVAGVVPPGGAGHFDVHCPLLSLPLIFQTRLDSIPAKVPYLHVDPAEKEKWAREIDKFSLATMANDSQKTRRLRVGLVWAGGLAYKDDHKRSITLKHFSPLASLPNITFFTLQKGPAAAQASDPPPGMKLLDLTAGLNDFADTAALIANLDLVISVDTAVAHLAGALNIPVWILLPYSPDWRWMLDREDSPWYPSMRLFRQDERGGWNGVIARVAAELSDQTRSV